MNFFTSCRFPPSTSHDNEEQQEVDEQTESRGQTQQIKRWRTKQGVVQLKATESTEQNAVDPSYAEVLRDV